MVDALVCEWLIALPLWHIDAERWGRPFHCFLEVILVLPLAGNGTFRPTLLLEELVKLSVFEIPTDFAPFCLILSLL